MRESHVGGERGGADGGGGGGGDDGGGGEGGFEGGGLGLGGGEGGDGGSGGGVGRILQRARRTVWSCAHVQRPGEGSASSYIVDVQMMNSPFSPGYQYETGSPTL